MKGYILYLRRDIVMGKCRRNYVQIINDYQLPPTRKIDINDQQWYVLIKCFMPLGFLSSVVGIFFLVAQVVVFTKKLTMYQETILTLTVCISLGL